MIPNPGDKRKKFMTREWFIEQEKRVLPQKLPGGIPGQSRIFGKLEENIPAATFTSTKITVGYGKLREWIYSGRNLVQSDIYHYVGNLEDRTYSTNDFVFADLYQTEYIIQPNSANVVLAYTTSTGTARSGTTFGTGTAEHRDLNDSGVAAASSPVKSYTYRNPAAGTIGNNKYIMLLKTGKHWLPVWEECP